MSVPAIVDTSIWVDVFRDASGDRRRQLEAMVDPEDVLLTPFTELELLQGCRDDEEWSLLAAYLETQEYLAPVRETWVAAARVFFDLRRLGKTVRSPVDCCIAQIAIERRVLLIHRDRGFEAIAEIRPLRQLFVRWVSR
jgi:predicted nucleic acid-binding protein